MMNSISLYEYQEQYYRDVCKALEIESLSISKGVILAMDTGLGKTYIATKLIQDLINRKTDIKILVLVRKKNIYDPWQELFANHGALPNSTYSIYTRETSQSLKSNIITTPDFRSYKVILTNYECLNNNIEDFSINWDLIIYDEIHDRDSKIKMQNVLSSLAKINVTKQLGLTASPLRNSFAELYILSEFIQNNKTIEQAYSTLDEKRQAITATVNKKTEYKGLDKKYLIEYIFEKNLSDELQDQIGKTILYYSKRDEKIPKLPSLVNRNIFLPLHHLQSAEAYFSMEGNAAKTPWENIAAYLETAPEYAIGSKVKNLIEVPSIEMRTSTKEVFTVELIQCILEHTTDKIVLFSQSTKVLTIFLNLIRNTPKMKSYSCTYIEGSTKDYMKKLEQFKKDPQKRIILVSIEAYKEGIDLRCANHIFFLDLPYNPQVLIQAKDRCHRTGQTKTVFAYYLFYESNNKYSPDNLRKEILKRKQILFDSFFNYDSKGNTLPPQIIENYSFSYNEGEKSQLIDINDNYQELRTSIEFLYMTKFSDKDYTTPILSDYEEDNINRFGINIHCKTIKTVETIEASPYDNMPLTN